MPEKKGKNILVTGGTGFIGSALVRRLVKDGFSVRVLDNDWRGREARLSDLKEKVEMRAGDIRDPATVKDACSGMDTVAHLAYINGTENFYLKPELVLEVGVKGMLNVLDGCIAAKVKNLLLMSSSEVYQTPPRVPTDETVPLSVPDPGNPRYSYGGGKIISELLTINYGRKHFERALIVRPHNVYGPDMGHEHVIPQFATRMRELCERQPAGVLDFPIQGSGRETRAFVFVDDFVEGVRLVMDKGENMGIYHLGTEDEAPISKVAEEVAKCFGREIRLVAGELQRGGTLRRCPSIAKAGRLGYAPKVRLAEGIRRTVEWYAANDA